jgi:hypothetical protein
MTDTRSPTKASVKKKPAPRTEIVYNVEPFRVGIRESDGKLVWRTPLPAAVELYNLAQDPSEKNNAAAEHPDIVTALQKGGNELASQAAKSVLLQNEFGAMQKRLQLPPALPDEDYQFNNDDFTDAGY